MNIWDRWFVRELKEEYPILISVSDVDLINRYRYISKVLRTDLKRSPETIEYLLNPVN